MIKKWLYWLNAALVGLVACSVVATVAIKFFEPPIPQIKPAAEPIRVLPVNSFSIPDGGLSDGMLKLKREAPSINLPNLRNIITYYGKNGRPDADPNNPLMHFGISGGKELASIHPKERLYILYDRTTVPPKYIFSPNNAQTPLWMEAFPSGNQAAIYIFMKNEEGELIRKPVNNAQITLIEKEYVRYAGSVWELNKIRVDATLLARQKARWYGTDKFLQNEGGPPYAEVASKQRIDFGEGNEIYSVFVDNKSCLTWTKGHWEVVSPGIKTLDQPLMCVQKIEDRLISFELWDVNGKGKIALNILKSSDAPLSKALIKTIKFVGARTLSQLLFEINNERMILTPDEWLVLKDQKWQVLRDPTEIQRFIDRKLIAPLLIFNGVDRSEDRQMLKGKLYNSSRTEMISITIPLLSGGTAERAKVQPNRGQINTGQAVQRSIEMPPNNADREDDDLDEEDDSLDDEEDESYD